ncbi:MAG: NAD(P)H-dependent glycerol-3-phosphate dehydrogenase [Pseudomonadota bacterium]
MTAPGAPPVAIIGAGAFGRALAKVASHGGPVRLIGRRRAEGVETDAAVGLEGAAFVILAVSAQATRAVLTDNARHLPEEAPLILAAKGVERGTGALQSEIAAETAPRHSRLALTGPSFAEDLMAGLPTAITLAADDAGVGEAAQARLAGPTFRPYASDDMIGAELGGALKNVVAIAVGAAAGMGLGDSARAALMTRGFAEMTRIAAARGARPETLAGLSGLGDLSLTCSGPKSRNFAYGFALGAGETPREGVTYEGAATATGAADMAARLGVEAPIMDAVASLARGETDAAGAMDALLSRPLRREA